MNPDLTAISQALDRLVVALHRTTWDCINTLAVVLTLGVLIWYTVETYKLRLSAQKQTEKTGSLLQEAQRQNEMSVMPMAAIFIQSTPNGNRAIVMGNVGSGAAFNLSIDRIRSGNGELLIEHGGNVMKVGDMNELGFQFQEQNSNTILHLDSLYEWINTGKLPDPLDIVVRCGSVNSVNYAFRFRFTPDATGRLKITFEGVIQV